MENRNVVEFNDGCSHFLDELDRAQLLTRRSEELTAMLDAAEIITAIDRRLSLQAS